MKQDRDDNKQERPLPLDYKIVKKWISEIHRSAEGNPALAEMLAYLYRLAQIEDSYLENDLFTIGKEVFNISEPSWDAFEDYAKGIFDKYAERPKTKKREPRESDIASPEATSGKATRFPLIDALAELFATAKEVTGPGNKTEMNVFRLALDAILKDLRNPDSAPELARAPTDSGQSRSDEDPETERYIELLDEYGNYEYVRPYLLEVMEAAERSGNREEFEQRILSNALAHILGSRHTPQLLFDGVTDAIHEISNNDAVADPRKSDNLREWFPVALKNIKEAKADAS